MSEKGKALVLASFAGDSLALGVHWIYSVKRMAREFGRVEVFLKPQPDSYHPTKDRGEFTHYGDQTFVLLQSLAENGTFDLVDFARRWRSMFDGYEGHYDQATRATLHNFLKGASPENSGSSSNEIAGAGRIAPLVYCLGNNLDALVASARVQTSMTHTDPLAVDSSEFFARISLRVLQGATPAEAVPAVAQEHFADSAFISWIDEGMKSASNDSVDAIKEFGQSCHTPEAFPGIIHLILKYENDLKEALIQAVIAGGDSAARAMIVGMILGAHQGMQAIPGQWVSELRRSDEINLLLDQIEQKRQKTGFSSG